MNNDTKTYQSINEEKTKAMESISIEIKDIVFDYFNIITKEYEISYDKYKNDDDFIN